VGQHGLLQRQLKVANDSDFWNVANNCIPKSAGG
jgi:hypothetical protein